VAGLQRAPWYHQLVLLRPAGAVPLSSRRWLRINPSDASRAPSEQVRRRHAATGTAHSGRFGMLLGFCTQRAARGSGNARCEVRLRSAETDSQLHCSR